VNETANAPVVLKALAKETANAGIANEPEAAIVNVPPDHVGAAALPESKTRLAAEGLARYEIKPFAPLA
jgi:hypothetical protein